MRHPLVVDCMTAPAVTERPDAPVQALVAVLRLRAISAVPIVDRDELVGIVSTTDLIRAPANARAKDVMSSPVVSVSARDPLDVAARRMVAGRVHRVVALDGGRVAGVLSARDVLAAVKARRLDVPIARVMSAPVVSIDVGAAIDDAVERLAAANVHGIVVTDGGAPVGVFTHAEALAARKLPADLQRGPVEEVMSYETICLDAATPIYRAAAYVVSMNVRRVLVVEHRRLAGIVSCIDLVDVLARAPDA